MTTVVDVSMFERCVALLTELSIATEYEFGVNFLKISLRVFSVILTSFCYMRLFVLQHGLYWVVSVRSFALQHKMS